MEKYIIIKKLQKIDDVNWKTSSDTEVILEAFCKWGPDFVSELNGSFLLSMTNKKTNYFYLEIEWV